MKKRSSSQQRRFWVKVVSVGLLAGLVGGGVAFSIDHAVSAYQTYSSTKVPTSSSKSGGTSVTKNKASLTNESTKAYNAAKNAVVSVINKQATSTDSLYGATASTKSNASSSTLETASEGSGVIYRRAVT